MYHQLLSLLKMDENFNKRNLDTKCIKKNFLSLDIFSRCQYQKEARKIPLKL